MRKTKTTRYDVTEHLRNPEETAAYLKACLEKTGDDAASIAKALGDIARSLGMTQWRGMSVYLGSVFIKRFQGA